MSDACRVAVATTSSLAADAAGEVAGEGGNAVDCAIAASLAAMNTEPGLCAMAGGAYITIWKSGDKPLTIDGGTAIPGLALSDDYKPDHGTPLNMAYGGGMDTIVGCASVGTPGALAACEHAASRFGRATWSAIVKPSICAARDGFPLPSASHYYLQYSGTPIFGRSEDGRRALHDANGDLLGAGDLIKVPHLADSLSAIANEGTRIFYEGEIGERIVEHVRRGGGSLTRSDLAAYAPIERPALTLALSDWQLALNPPPAVGGAVLAAMLLGFSTRAAAARDAAMVTELIRVQRATLDYRRQTLDLADDVSAAADALLSAARSGQLLKPGRSAATVHTSAVDSDGLACSITSSAGYGSGEMPAGTGLWLNNSVGEVELNKRGFDAGPPGARLPSNMSPGVARSGDRVLAFGSPGADRITTALQQFLINHMQLGMPIREACAAPRLHVEVAAEPVSISAEASLDIPDLGIPVRRYADASMYFGGVGAAEFTPGDGLSAAADPRREGGTFVAT